MHFIDTEKTRCFLNLMIQMHSAPSVFYRKAGCTKEFLATVSYNLLKVKTSPLLDLENEFWGKREWERGEKKKKEGDGGKTNQKQSSFETDQTPFSPSASEISFISVMNSFSKTCRSFWGEFRILQLCNLPCSVRLARPPAFCKTPRTSQSWGCASITVLYTCHWSPAKTMPSPLYSQVKVVRFKTGYEWVRGTIVTLQRVILYYVWCPVNNAWFYTALKKRFH